MTASLYAQVLGDAFHRLAPALRRFHALSGRHVLDGQVEVQAPAGLAARLLAIGLGAPRHAGTGPLRFELDADAHAEQWTRCFPGRRMASRFRASGGLLQEQLGAARLTFSLHEEGGALHMRLVGLRFLGVPCPRWLMPAIMAREQGDGAHLRFEVSATVPGIGRVASYRGHLQVPDQEAP